jgi:hypothetical protein
MGFIIFLVQLLILVLMVGMLIKPAFVRAMLRWRLHAWWPQPQSTPHVHTCCGTGQHRQGRVQHGLAERTRAASPSSPKPLVSGGDAMGEFVALVAANLALHQGQPWAAVPDRLGKA